MTMMISRILFLFLSIFPTITFASSNGTNIVAAINARSSDGEADSLSLFRDALHATGMLDNFLGNHSATFTVFAPTNKAFYNSPQLQQYMVGLDEKPYPRWHQNLKNALKQHIVVDHNYSSADIFDLTRDELPSLTDPIKLNQFETLVQDSEILEADIVATNGIMHVITTALKPLFFDQTFAQLELQSELGPDDLGRTALTDVVDFVDGRDLLTEVNEDGTTFLGCRIRAFNRLEEYLPQTVNESPEGVIFGEFLNASYTTETVHNFLEYSLIPRNYYNDDIDGKQWFVELTVPVANCGHMWVTKKDGNLCFNNGCVVDEPQLREYSAMNGCVSFCICVVLCLYSLLP